ncbi:MAG: FdtA/QdtA family cupin domain-containing protein [Methylophilaceae bacterium]|jgi:dTDP-4-dehydrorhamnose 3,5-epimerase-like enzyme|nr:FdtA/QdtA family cupin domain-containing protein [Methylophilaceae bacterium]
MVNRNYFSTLKSVKLIDLPYYSDQRGDLSVMQGGGNIPFNISRLFTVRAPKDAVRGMHAHRKCTQFMVCASGMIKVLCDDGKEKESYLLNNASIGLIVPPGIWAEETYMKDNTVLNVLCDRPYEEEDYIKKYENFLLYCKAKNNYG